MTSGKQKRTGKVSASVSILGTSGFFGSSKHTSLGNRAEVQIRSRAREVISGSQWK